MASSEIAAGTNWVLEGAKLAIPVFLGAAIWTFQTLAQRAWTEYERRLDAYNNAIQLIDSMFVFGAHTERPAYLRAIRKIWLVGSDEVVLAANAFSASIRDRQTQSEMEMSYRNFIAIMRQDMRRRRWLPPRSTAMSSQNFPIETATRDAAQDDVKPASDATASGIAAEVS